MDLKNEIENTQVVVFAGGAGKRMNDSSLPKALQKVAGKALIDWCIEFYARHGFKDFVLLVGYLHVDIESHIGDGSKHGVSVRYSIDPEGMNIGKGKAFKHAIQNGRIDLNKRAIIAYPDDIYLDENLPLELLEKHLDESGEKKAIATMVCVSSVKYPYGVALAYDGDFVEEFFEKPLLQVPTSVGLLVVEPEVYKVVEDVVEMNVEEAVEFEKVVLPRLVKTGRMKRMMIQNGRWIAVNTQKELEDAERALQEKK